MALQPQTSPPEAEGSSRRMSPLAPRPAVRGQPSQEEGGSGPYGLGPPSLVPPCTYLVPPSVVTLINSDDAVSKVSQSVQAVGPLLQGPKSYILVVGNPGAKERVTRWARGPQAPCLPPTPPRAQSPCLTTGPGGKKAATRPRAPSAGLAVPRDSTALSLSTPNPKCRF